MSTYSTPGLFGEIIHRDEYGNETGVSWPGMFGGSWDHYGSDGNIRGHSDPGVFAAYVHTDNYNNRTGTTYEASSGYYTTFDEDGFAGTTIAVGYGGDSDFDF